MLEKSTRTFALPPLPSPFRVAPVRVAPVRVVLALALAALVSPAAGSSASVTPASPGEMLEGLADLHFDVMETRQGLPHESVYGFSQDSTGFLWIATFSGLGRFDGNRVHSWFHESGNPRSLPDNNVRVLLPAGNGRIWVGTGSFGVVQYDPVADTFWTLPGQSSLLSRARVFCLIHDDPKNPAGPIWFGTELGLANYDPARQSWQLFGRLTGKADRHGFPDSKIFSLLRDRSGNLWVGSEKGVFVCRPGTSNFALVPGIEGPGEIGERPPVWSFLETADGRIVVGTDATGAGVYDPASGRFRGLPGLAGRNSLIGAHTVRGIVEVRPGELWLATYGGGLVTTSLVSGRSRRWMRNPTSPASLSNDFLRGIFQDRSGLIWLATDKGASRTNPQARGVLNIHATEMQSQGFEGFGVESLGYSAGRIWVGFDQGGIAAIEADGTVRRVVPAPGIPDARTSRREVLALKAASDGTLFAGGFGLFAVDPKTLTYRPVPVPLLDNQLIRALCLDGDILWAATYIGLVRYDRRSGNSQIFQHDAASPGSLSDNNVRDILKSSDGRLWVTSRMGLDLFEPATGTFRHIRRRPNRAESLPSENLQRMLEDSHGRIWIGTLGSGLTVLAGWSKSGEPLFHTLDRKVGFPAEIVLAIAEGKDGRIWANTPRGLAVIDPNNFQVQTLTAADGMRTSAQNLFSSVALWDGTILFPGDSGILAVRPSRLQKWVFKAPLTVSEVRVPGRHVAAVSLAETVRAGVLQLSGSERGFQAVLSLLDFSDPGNTRYRYKLLGLDQDWVDATVDQSLVSYGNLPPGNYRLLARASSRGGTGAETVLDLPVQVLPAWYETWWFGAVKVGLVLLAMLAIVRLRTGYLRRQQRELGRQVAQRTAELEEKSVQLLDANRQLEMLATSDPLTGILNRRSFLDLAKLELERSVRSGQPVGIILADIDNLKVINDQQGHRVGDVVIMETAARLAGNLRSIDLLCRFGGDEFVILLPETAEEAMQGVAERLRRSVADVPVERLGEAAAGDSAGRENVSISISLSIGMAQWVPREDLQSLIDRADVAMYGAKREGRNRVSPAAGSPAKVK